MESISISFDDKTLAAVEQGCLTTWDIPTGTQQGRESEADLRRSVNTFDFEKESPGTLRCACFTRDATLLLASAKGERGLGATMSHGSVWMT